MLLHSHRTSTGFRRTVAPRSVLAREVLTVGQETIQPVLAYQILRRFVRPLVSVLPSDIDVLVNDLDAWIELRLNAPLFQAYRQVLNLVMPQF
jgi:hypothetical protein